MKKDNNLKKYIIAIVIVLTIAIIGFTSAAFMTGYLGGDDTSVSADVTEAPELEFSKSGDISINASVNNFGGSDSITSSVTTSATLKASGEYTTSYNVYFSIKSNNYIYTSEEEYPELLLVVTDKDGNTVKSIDGLEYVTYGSYEGFDITVVKGTYLVKGDVSITTDGVLDKVDDYTFEVVFVNLGEDVNQNGNTNKELVAQVDMTQEEICADWSVGSFADSILSNNGGVCEISKKDDPDFSTAIGTGMYAYDDNYGESYYFRGEVDNNWLKFGQEDGKDIWWRITRINGDGTIRIIYSGTTAPTESQSVVMTGDGTSISSSVQFYSSYSSAEYVGYMYTIGENHGLGTSSTIKGVIDTWYETNLSSYSEYISHNTSFCYNRTAYSDQYGNNIASGTGKSLQYFKSYVNLVKNNTPSLICDNINDYYTVDEEDNGNNALNSPIGLMSADEAALAGSIYGTSNSSHYLFTNNDYWLGSPYFYYANAYAFYVNSYGSLNNASVSTNFGARAVVSLIRDIHVTGSGSYSDPYIVV